MFSSPAARRSPALAASAAPAARCPARRCAATGAREAEAKALLDSVRANTCCAFNPEGATSLGIDTGARAPLRYRLGDHQPAGRQRFAADDRRRSRAGRGDRHVARSAFPTRTSVEVVKSAYSTGARGLCFPVRRRRGRRLSQHALRRHPERRRLHRHAAIPRHRSSDREPRPTPKPISRGLRNIRAQLDGELGRMRAARAPRAGPAQLPDRQGAHPARHRAQGRAQGGGLVESLVRRDQGKGHRRRLGRARPPDRRPARSRPRSSGRSTS